MTVPAGPDANGLRHQLQGEPAGQIALGIEKRSQYAVGRYRDAAGRGVVRHANHFFKQQHRRIVRQIVSGR
ncbi:hypothetical protein D3C81_2221350 [compost metagenome]